MSEKAPEPGSARGLKNDARPPRGLWAPGDYLNTCLKCRQNFIGDKRAAHCADCAYIEPYACSKCSRPVDGLVWFHLSHGTDRLHFCSRRCLVEFIAPEVAKAIVVGQWVPTPEESERMSQ